MGFLFVDNPATRNFTDWVQGNILGRDGEYTLVDGVQQSRVFYGAVRRELDGLTFALVLLLAPTPTQLGYRSFTEDVGPNPTTCPRQILDQLSPLEDLYPQDPASPDNEAFENAAAWRAACRTRGQTTIGIN
ncbi:MAG: hypothetical protein JHD02_00350 [Thermoleophilaceae bacterium]|nr:hypothetical protein [Thermoleophilaceae bacterium]